MQMQLKIIEGCRLPVKRDLEGQVEWRKLCGTNLVQWFCLDNHAWLIVVALTAESVTRFCVDRCFLLCSFLYKLLYNLFRMARLQIRCVSHIVQWLEIFFLCCLLWTSNFLHNKISYLPADSHFHKSFHS